MQGRAARTRYSGPVAWPWMWTALALGMGACGLADGWPWCGGGRRCGYGMGGWRLKEERSPEGMAGKAKRSRV